jgi:hypothetical protein
MEFDSNFKKEVTEYIDLRLDEGADDATILKEVGGRFPVVITDVTVAAMYLTYCKEKRKARGR